MLMFSSLSLVIISYFYFIFIIKIIIYYSMIFIYLYFRKKNCGSAGLFPIQLGLQHLLLSRILQMVVSLVCLESFYVNYLYQYKSICYVFIFQVYLYYNTIYICIFLINNYISTLFYFYFSFICWDKPFIINYIWYLVVVSVSSNHFMFHSDGHSTDG